MRSFLTYTGFLVLTLIGLLLVACGGAEEGAVLPDPEPVAGETVSEVRDSLMIQLTGIDSTSVLDLLLGEHQVDYRESVAGAFVTGIDSVSAGEGHFWVFSVNDSMAQVACDKYLTRSGDQVMWHFRDMSR